MITIDETIEQINVRETPASLLELKAVPRDTIAWRAPETDPALVLGSDYENRFGHLPLAVRLEIPWAGSYLPWRDNCIGKRNYPDREQAVFYKNPTWDEIARMTPEELLRLSALEKLAIISGSLGMLREKDEGFVSFTNEVPVWCGSCHGLADAGLLFPEPKAVVMQAGDLEIPFTSADVKAWLTLIQADKHYRGEEVNSAATIGGNTRDFSGHLINAGAFHLVVTNSFARGTSLVMNLSDEPEEIWNRPVFGFESTSEQLHKNQDGTSLLGVKTRLDYMVSGEADAEYRLTPQCLQSMQLEYVLTLDPSERIIGGEWQSTRSPATVRQPKRFKSINEKYAKIAEVFDLALS